MCTRTTLNLCGHDIFRSNESRLNHAPLLPLMLLPPFFSQLTLSGAALLSSSLSSNPSVIPYTVPISSLSSSRPGTCPFRRSKSGGVPQAYLCLLFAILLFLADCACSLHTPFMSCRPTTFCCLARSPPHSPLLSLSQPTLVAHLIHSSSVILISWPAYLIPSLLNPPPSYSNPPVYVTSEVERWRVCWH